MGLTPDPADPCFGKHGPDKRHDREYSQSSANRVIDPNRMAESRSGITRLRDASRQPDLSSIFRAFAVSALGGRDAEHRP